MLKKLLTLSLVAVMLSVTALASPGGVMLMDATYAEEAEEVTEVFKYENIELLWVSQTTGEDSTVSQTVTALSWDTKWKAGTASLNAWALAKINVGENWDFSKVTFRARLGAYKGECVAYYMPLTKADYDAAKAVAGTGTTISSLSEPETDEAAIYQVLESNWTKSNNSKQSYTFTFDPESFTSAHYQNGYIYIAFQPQNTTSSRSLALWFNADETNINYDQAAYWNMTVTGTKVETPAVTDFSDAEITWNNGAYTVKTATASGTAMLVAASFNGTTMVDAKVVTIDATTAQDGVISGTISDLEAGTSVKVFLWANNTLVPAIGVSEF